jgi:hypothetical protein
MSGRHSPDGRKPLDIAAVKGSARSPRVPREAAAQGYACAMWWMMCRTLFHRRLAATVEAFRHPSFRLVEIGHREGAYLAGNKNGQNAQCGSEPALIADNSNSLVCSGVTGRERELLLCRVSLVFPEPRPEEIQQAICWRSTGATTSSKSSSSTLPTASKPAVPGGISVIWRNILISFAPAVARFRTGRHGCL